MAEGAPDFGRVFGRMIHRLAQLEDKAEAQIIRDMAETSADAISFRVMLDGGRASRLPLAYAPTIFKAAHDVTIAAANAASRIRSSYRNWTKEVREFADRAEVGQTEAGSYVVRVLCPVTHVPQPQLQRVDDQAPFERRVTNTLHRALSATRRAAERAITNGELAVFEEAIDDGVSSNMCRALASVGSGPELVALEIGLRWAALRDQSIPSGGSFYFGQDYLEVLDSAASHLRELEGEEFEDQEVMGLVWSLDRSPMNGEAGLITINGFIPNGGYGGRDRVMKCSMELPTELYTLAARAHVEHRLVSVWGTVRRAGRRWWLEDLSRFWIDDPGASALGE